LIRIYQIIILSIYITILSIPANILAEESLRYTPLNKMNAITIATKGEELNRLRTSRGAKSDEIYRIKSLLKVFNESDPTSRNGVMGKLLDIRPAVFAEIIKDECFRKALSKIGRPAVPLLLTALDNENASVRRHAIHTLGQIRRDATDAVPILIKKLDDNDQWVRITIINALQEIGLPEDQIISAITKMLSDKNPGVRESAVRALLDFGRNAKQAAPALKDLMSHDIDEFVREDAKTALKRIGPTSVSDYFIAYYFVPLLILAFIWRFLHFLKWHDITDKAIYYFISACFGHPIYLILSMWITHEILIPLHYFPFEKGIASIFVYIAILIVIFLLRFFFFLYLSWMKSHLSLKDVMPISFNKYLIAHRKCVWGLPLFIVCISPIVDQNIGTPGLFILPIVGIILILGLGLSSVTLVLAFESKDWVHHQYSSGENIRDIPNDIMLDPNEKGYRIIASLLLLGIIMIVVSVGLRHQWPEREGGPIGIEKQAQRALRREEPGSARYYIRKGLNYFDFYGVNSGNADRAISEYNTAIEIDPNSSWAYESRGRAYWQLGKYDQAILDYTRVEEIGDDIKSDIYEKRGIAYKELKQYDKMCEDYRRSCCGPTCNSYIHAKKEGFCKN